MHLVCPRVYPRDLADHELDAVRDEAGAWLDELFWGVAAEGEQQQPRLVQVRVVLIDDRDRPLRGIELVAELVHHHRARSAGTQNH